VKLPTFAELSRACIKTRKRKKMEDFYVNIQNK